MPVALILLRNRLCGWDSAEKCSGRCNNLSSLLATLARGIFPFGCGSAAPSLSGKIYRINSRAEAQRRAEEEWIRFVVLVSVCFALLCFALLGGLVSL